MILDDNGMDTLIQETADRSNAPQEVYQRKNGTIVYCAKGMITEVKRCLPANEQLRYLRTVKPSTWPKDDQMQ